MFCASFPVLSLAGIARSRATPAFPVPAADGLQDPCLRGEWPQEEREDGVVEDEDDGRPEYHRCDAEEWLGIIGRSARPRPLTREWAPDQPT